MNSCLKVEIRKVFATSGTSWFFDVKIEMGEGHVSLCQENYIANLLKKFRKEDHCMQKDSTIAPDISAHSRWGKMMKMPKNVCKKGVKLWV